MSDENIVNSDQSENLEVMAIDSLSTETISDEAMVDPFFSNNCDPALVGEMLESVKINIPEKVETPEPEVKKRGRRSKEEIQRDLEIAEAKKLAKLQAKTSIQAKENTEDGNGFVEVTKELPSEGMDGEEPDTESETLRQELQEVQELETTTGTVGMEPCDKATLDLYDEFSSFLSVAADIKADKSEKQVIPTGIKVFDASIGGGFAVGAFHTIAGAPGSGKSMLAMQTLGNAQKIYKGMLAGYLDSEESTSTKRLASMGVISPKITPITDITIEKIFKYLETLCVFKVDKKIKIPSVIIWDSIANTLSQKEREAADINSVIGYKARMLSILIPKYVAKCAQHDICWLSVNQLRDSLSIGPYGPPKELRFLSTGKSLPGGTTLRYNAFQLIEMKVKSGLDPLKWGFDGIQVAAITVKNKLAPPNVSTQLIGSFTHGFSDFWTSWLFLVENKRLTTGGWNYLRDAPHIKIRTKDAFETYNTNEDFKFAWDNAVEECIKVEIIDKFEA